MGLIFCYFYINKIESKITQKVQNKKQKLLLEQSSFDDKFAWKGNYTWLDPHAKNDLITI